jgi:hypothetical protein
VLHDLSPSILEKMKRRYGYPKEKERQKKERRIKGIAISKKI